MGLRICQTLNKAYPEKTILTRRYVSIPKSLLLTHKVRQVPRTLSSTANPLTGNLLTRTLPLLQPTLLSRQTSRTLGTATQPLISNLVARTLPLLKLVFLGKIAGTLGTTVEPLVADLVARALARDKVALHLVVALCAGADPVVADFLADA